jgi:hypothetical protein
VYTIVGHLFIYATIKTQSVSIKPIL